MKILNRFKKLVIAWILLLTACIALIIFGIWTSPPREYIQNDPELMAIHPFTKWMLTICFIICFAVFCSFGIKLIKLLANVEKGILESKR